MRRLKETQYHSPERILEAQNRRLAAMVRHAAGTSVFYRERFAAAGIDPMTVESIEDLRNLPLLTKSDIRSHTDIILSSAYRKRDLVLSKTGGSTGVALEVYCDARGIEMRNGAALRTDEWSGWRLGEPRGAVWGNPPLARTLKSRVRTTLKDRVVYLDTMKFDTATVDGFVAGWKRLRPSLLFGHAHSIYLLAEDLRQRGIDLRPRGIIATSMMLIEPERDVIESVFDCPVTNRYGCEEVSLIGSECEIHEGMHLNADHNIVEFLDDDGAPCAPGREGRLVVTELINFGMPMLRYEVGDRGVPSDRVCPCGRGLPLMESLTGRTADFLLAEGGFRVAGISIIENTLTRIPGLRQMQIVQDRPDHLRVNLVPGREYGDRTEAELCAALRDMLGAGMRIDLNRVDVIPMEKSGKYRFTKCII